MIGKNILEREIANLEAQLDERKEKLGRTRAQIQNVFVQKNEVLGKLEGPLVFLSLT